MIAIETRGRLGNQMFQFAFGLAAAAHLGTDFAFDEGYLRRWFTLAPRGGRAARARRAAAYRLRARTRPFPILKFEPTATSAEVFGALRDGAQYTGFFQSEEFFAEAATAVARAFEPRPAHAQEFRRRYSDLLETDYVCCHIRRTDYLTWGGGVALPIGFYERCLARVAPAPVVFVGDDLGAARQRFGDRADVRFEQNDEILDLLLLRHASVVVTSNSSFGWWGAWLGGRRRVLAPRHWLGFKRGREVPPDVVPAGWEQVPVDDG